MKFLKPILIGTSSVAVVAPVATLTSCNQSLLNGLKGIDVKWRKEDVNYYLILNMLFTKNIATVDDGYGSGEPIINCNNVICKYTLSHDSKYKEERITATATDSTIFCFYWSCNPVWEQQGSDWELIAINNFKVHDIDWK